MGLTKRVAGNNLPKEPMDVIHKSNRLEKKLQELRKDPEIKELDSKKINIQIYDCVKDKIIEESSLGNNLLSKERLAYYLKLPVIKIAHNYINRPHKAKNCKSAIVTELDSITITIKCLPETYVASPLYALGYIDDLIYDHIMIKEPNQPGETLMGSETFDLIMQYMIKTTNKSDINSMEKLFKKICGYDVLIRPTDFCRNKHTEYYIIEKILNKKGV